MRAGRSRPRQHSVRGGTPAGVGHHSSVAPLPPYTPDQSLILKGQKYKIVMFRFYHLTKWSRSTGNSFSFRFYRVECILMFPPKTYII